MATGDILVVANKAEVTTELALKSPLASPTFTGTVGGIDKTMVGLGNVDNTSDVNKPVSIETRAYIDSATQTNTHRLMGTRIL